MANNNSSSFKYKSNLIASTVVDGANRKKEGVKMVVPLKWYETPLINCKVELSLTYFHFIENCVPGNSTFKITDAKLFVPVVTLSTEGNGKLSKLLTEGSVYWNEYRVIPEQRYDANYKIRKLIDPSWQRINRLFVLAYLNDANSTVNSHRKYFLPRVGIENYNIEADRRNFYDQSINDLIKQYDEVRETSTGHGDDYTTSCLLDFACFKKYYRLIAANLSKQKVLNSDSRSI